jgi:hypothetical protein
MYLQFLQDAGDGAPDCFFSQRKRFSNLAILHARADHGQDLAFTRSKIADIRPLMPASALCAWRVTAGARIAGVAMNVMAKKYFLLME